MLTAIKELGEIKLEMEGKDISDIVSILVEDPNNNGRFPYMLVVIFEENNGQLIYSGIQPEQTDKSKVVKYLYRFYSPNGPDYTLTVRISESISKVFHNKIQPWFKRNPSETPFLKEFERAFTEHKEEILKDLETKWETLEKGLKQGQRGAITFGIRKSGVLYYLGDLEEFRELLVNKVKERYEQILKREHICSVCGRVVDEVYGNAIPFAFYTVDKPGYIAGGFNEHEAWKNAPVCLECSLKIEEGKKLLDERLTFRMGGQRYYLIPKFIFGGRGDEDLIIELFGKTEESPEVLAELKKLSEDEREILSSLKELDDIVTFNFMFYETPTRSTFRINLLIEDVLPSRLNQLFQAKEKADRCDFLHNVKVKKNKYDNIEFRFNEFKRFTPSNKAFLEIVDKSFRGLPTDRDLIFSWLMGRIIPSFIKNEYLKPLVLRGLSALLFFNELGILKLSLSRMKDGGGEMMTEIGPDAEGFFGRYEEAFPASAHKALFLLGALTQKLLDIQFATRGSTPFRKNLKGLKMKEEDFRGLLPKIQNKLEEYGKNYYQSLESLISEYFLLAGRGWGMSTDEMNFYFVLGMNLHDEISKALGLKEKNEEEEV
jgi:CRISPR-associated protein Csh1